MKLTELEKAVRSAKTVARRPLRRPTRDKVAANREAYRQWLLTAGERQDNSK